MSQFAKQCAQALGPIIGKPAPHFKAAAWCAQGQAFKDIKLEDYKNKYLLLFFYPLDFTFVCPTEIIEFSNHTKQFRETGCEVLGCSIDSQHTHRQWTLKEKKDGGIGKIEYPLLADTNHQVLFDSTQIAHNYGVLTEKGVALRGTFIIDDEQILRHISINDLGVGRNVAEYLRLVKV
jgi:peroxiredoxin 1